MKTIEESDIDLLKEVCFILDKIYRRAFRLGFEKNNFIIKDSQYLRFYPDSLSEEDFKNNLNWIYSNSCGLMKWSENKDSDYYVYLGMKEHYLNIGDKNSLELLIEPKDKNEIKIVVKDWKKFKKYYEVFLEKIEKKGKVKNTTKVDSSSNLFLIIDGERGIYFKDYEEEIYPLKRIRSGKITKRFTVVKLFLTSDLKVLTDNLISKEINQDKKLLKKEIRSINNLFRKKVGVADDLIIYLDTGGYKLNREKFNIKYFNLEP